MMFMNSAIALAKTQLGQTWPNPAVAAIVEKDGVIIGRGVTAKGGRPHAETQALDMAGSAAAGATLYVTLEPCSHTGKTPPCVDAIIKSGIRKVVIACRDPDSRVMGSGIAALQATGIEIIENVCKAEAEAVNRGFFSRIQKGRPYVALKIATTLDGKIATASNESKWITGEKSRQRVHLLRSQFDAVITGIGTILADDPQLTCRLNGCMDRNPVRVILDSELRLPKSSKLVTTLKEAPIWMFARPAVVNNVWPVSGIKIFPVKEYFQGLDLEKVLQTLAEQGVTRVLVEAGTRVMTSFIRSNLVDTIYWFRSAMALGSGGRDGIDNLNINSITESLTFSSISIESINNDTLEILEANPR